MNIKLQAGEKYILSDELVKETGLPKVLIGAHGNEWYLAKCKIPYALHDNYQPVFQFNLSNDGKEFLQIPLNVFGNYMKFHYGNSFIQPALSYLISSNNSYMYLPQNYEYTIDDLKKMKDTWCGFKYLNSDLLYTQFMRIKGLKENIFKVIGDVDNLASNYWMSVPDQKKLIDMEALNILPEVETQIQHVFVKQNYDDETEKYVLSFYVNLTTYHHKEFINSDILNDIFFTKVFNFDTKMKNRETFKLMIRESVISLRQQSSWQYESVIKEFLRAVIKSYNIKDAKEFITFCMKFKKR